MTMTDIFTKRKRSEIMSKIKSKNTGLEKKFMTELRREGFRFKTHYRVAGKPDFAFPSKRTAVFLDSCFWHGCQRHVSKPSSNRKFWDEKISRNRKRDAQVNRLLKKEGWKVVRVWEHELKNTDRVMNKIRRSVEGG